MIAFPLVPSRRGDRTFFNESFPGQDIRLDVPQSRGSRVRLQMTMPYRDETGKVSLLVEWPKRRPFPDPRSVSAQIWNQITSSAPSLRSRTGLAFFKVEVDSWRGFVYLPREGIEFLGNVDPANAVVWLGETLAWADRLLVGRRPSDRNVEAWIYRMHRYTALLVACEIAEAYLTNRQSLRYPRELEQAEGELRRRIAAVWSSHSGRTRVTPQRLALILVDAKFDGVKDILSPLALEYHTVLATGHLWRKVMPRESARRLRALAASDPNGAAWFKRWRSRILSAPLVPYTFFTTPGDEAWASYVWHALKS